MVMRMRLSRWLKSMPEYPVPLSVAVLTSAAGVGVTIPGSSQLRSTAEADCDIHSIKAGPPGRALRCCGVGVGVAAGVLGWRGRAGYGRCGGGRFLDAVRAQVLDAVSAPKCVGIGSGTEGAKRRRRPAGLQAVCQHGPPLVVTQAEALPRETRSGNRTHTQVGAHPPVIHRLLEDRSQHARQARAIQRLGTG